jgi:hypothetical protein
VTRGKFCNASPAVLPLLLIVVITTGDESGGGVRAFAVTMPSGERYWTVLDEALEVVPDADAFLFHVRFGRDGSELTTKAHAGGIALFLRWCGQTGRSWHEGVENLGLFMTWLRHAGPGQAATDGPSDQVLAGPGAPPVRGARRVNAVLAAVRGMALTRWLRAGPRRTWCRWSMRLPTDVIFPTRPAGRKTGCSCG